MRGSCSSAAHRLASGTWQVDTAPAACDAGHSAFDVYSAMYRCPLRARRRWVATCDHEAVHDRGSLVKAMAAAGVDTLWFVGESMLSQVAFAAACRARVAGNGLGWHWERPSWAFTTSAQGGGAHCANSSTDVSGSRRRICFLTAGAGSSLTTAQALRVLASRRLSRITDVAVVKPGAYQVENASRHAALAAELVDLLRAPPERLPRVLFLEAPASHFGTRDGWWQPHLKEDHCWPLPPHPPLPAAFAVSSSVLRAARLPPSRFVHVDGVWRFSVALVDAHPGLVNRTNAGGRSVESRRAVRQVLDCTHFCLESGVSDALVDAVEAQLQRAWAT